MYTIGREARKPLPGWSAVWHTSTKAHSSANVIDSVTASVVRWKNGAGMKGMVRAKARAAQATAMEALDILGRTSAAMAPRRMPVMRVPQALCIAEAGLPDGLIGEMQAPKTSKAGRHKQDDASSPDELLNACTEAASSRWARPLGEAPESPLLAQQRTVGAASQALSPQF